MMIDFHTHIFPDKIAKKTLEFLGAVCHSSPYTDGTRDGLLQSAANAQIELSVVLPIVTNPAQFTSINQFAVQNQEGGTLSFGGIYPKSENYKEELRQIRDMGLKGIKLHPDYQDIYFNDIRCKRIVEYASELNLIISVHAGRDPKCPDDVHCTPQMAAEVLDEVQPDKLVLAHLGGNEQWDEVETYLVGKKVYFDTGVVLGKVPDEQFVRMVRNHGKERILFATDSPWAEQSGYVNYLEQMELTAEEKSCILGENARKLLEI